MLEEAGDHVVVDGDAPSPLVLETQDTERALIWRDSGYAATRAPLKAVFAELERRYDVEIKVADSSILDDSLTIMFSKLGTIEEILEDICVKKSLNYREMSRGYEIY